MPTQEERLAALEQTQAQFNEAVSDLNHHVTILTGMMSRQEWDIREIKSSLRSIDSRLGTFEQSVNSRFEAQEKKLDQVLLLLNTFTPKPEQET